MPMPGVDPLIGDAEDLSSWRERMRRWAVRDLKHQDIVDIFLEDGEYPKYGEPEPNLAAYAQGGFHNDAEKLRYSLELTGYNENMKQLTKASKKLISTMLAQICTKSQKEVAKAADWEEAVRDHDVMELLKKNRGDTWWPTIHRSWSAQAECQGEICKL